MNKKYLQSLAIIALAINIAKSLASTKKYSCITQFEI